MSGPKSPFYPVFPDPFIQQARVEVRRKTAPYQLIQRYRRALLLHEHAELNNEQAAQQVGSSGRQVRRWRQRWAMGDFSVSDRPGRGRKPVFFPRWITRWSKRLPVNGSQRLANP